MPSFRVRRVSYCCLDRRVVDVIYTCRERAASGPMRMLVVLRTSVGHVY